MPARIETVRMLDVHGEAKTTPFAWTEEERALAHVGVIAHRIHLLGEDRVVAGIHAVCVAPRAAQARLGRRCVEAALTWIDERFDLTKLSIIIPALYARWRFGPRPCGPTERRPTEEAHGPLDDKRWIGHGTGHRSIQEVHPEWAVRAWI